MLFVCPGMCFNEQKWLKNPQKKLRASRLILEKGALFMLIFDFQKSQNSNDQNKNRKNIVVVGFFYFLIFKIPFQHTQTAKKT
jgi:hypothetical protein